MTTRPWVCIILGSDSDAAVMSQACGALDEAGIPYEMKVASAHRSPERTKQIVTDAERDGAGVFIAGAGMAAHLPGVVASLTTVPVPLNVSVTRVKTVPKPVIVVCPV